MKINLYALRLKARGMREKPYRVMLLSSVKEAEIIRIKGSIHNMLMIAVKTTPIT